MPKLTKIPRVMFQTWDTQDLSPEALMLTQSWRTLNPHYSWCLFDENDRRDFIAKHFGERISSVYCRIIPGAYKADLFRFSILYHFGGVFIDLDSICVTEIDNFLDENTELLSSIDRPHRPYLLFNSFIAVIPRHPVMLDCVNRIVANVDPGPVPLYELDVTGPGVFGRAVNVFLGRAETESYIGMYGHALNPNFRFLVFDPNQRVVLDPETDQIFYLDKDRSEVLNLIYSTEKRRINCVEYAHNKTPVSKTPLDAPPRLTSSPSFPRYISGDMCIQRIPRLLFQTWVTKTPSPEMKMLTSTWIDRNPKYIHRLVDDSDQLEFLQRHFDKKVVDAYSCLIPGAYKSALWRYCILYVVGGVYADIDTLCLGGMIDEILDETTEFAIAIDLAKAETDLQYLLFTGFMASVPKHPVLLECINRIVSNVENQSEFGDRSWIEVCGPGVVGRALNVYLGRAETTPFKDMHRTVDGGGKIKLLRFEPKTEVVIDTVTGHKILQNKNGNKIVSKIYNSERQRLGLLHYSEHTLLYRPR